jgi:hypothetical protein
MIATGRIPTPATQTDSLELVRCLDYVVIERRSATLDDSIPLRAVHCKPFQDGNTAGFHLRLVEPAVLHKDPAVGTMQFSDESYARITGDYAARIDQLVERGLLARDGYWHQQLRHTFLWREDDTLFLWTGLLLRPAPGTWFFVSGAYNLRCLVGLHDHVIPDEDAFTPLVLRFNLASLREQVTWLDTDLACLVPLRPDLHEISTFDCFATPDGFTYDYPGRERLQFAVIHNICDVTGTFREVSLEAAGAAADDSDA